MKPVYFNNSGSGLRRFIRWDGFSLSAAKGYVSIYGPAGWSASADADWLYILDENGDVVTQAALGNWLLMDTFTTGPTIVSDYTMYTSGNTRLP